jgi:uncharacterized membrane protein YgdD (TMEM256/DUF423 family)
MLSQLFSDTMDRTFAVIGALMGFVGVALGAFAAHSLKTKLTVDMFSVWEVGVRYHFYHALGLFVVAWVSNQFPESRVAVAGWLFIAGIVLFSGSLYTMGLTGIRGLGVITPVGGVCFLVGWAWLAWCLWRSV